MLILSSTLKLRGLGDFSIATHAIKRVTKVNKLTLDCCSSLSLWPSFAQAPSASHRGTTSVNIPARTQWLAGIPRHVVTRPHDIEGPLVMLPLALSHYTEGTRCVWSTGHLPAKQSSPHRLNLIREPPPLSLSLSSTEPCWDAAARFLKRTTVRNGIFLYLPAYRRPLPLLPAVAAGGAASA